MKQRQLALDGLRGFAAFAVVLSHITGISFANAPLLQILFYIISSGPNAVQILFVLTGFLMAYLHADLASAFHFLQKRYARIFPIYTVVVLALWIATFQKDMWFLQFLTLLLIAIIGHVFWKMLKKINQRNRIGRIIFTLFIFLQIGVLIFYIFIEPKVFPYLSTHVFWNSFFVMLANLTLTMPVSFHVTFLNKVFWSLILEVIFYLLFPFFVVPLIQLARKGGVIITILIIIGLTKILFDMDFAMNSLGALLVMNISRASGFIPGVLLGVMYSKKTRSWQVLEKILSLRGISFFIFCLFLFIQWGDTAVRANQNFIYSDYYFLVSSWIIMLVVGCALLPGTIIYKIFKHQVLVFLGMISFSMYLIHYEIITWVASVYSSLKFTNYSPLFIPLTFILVVILVIFVSYVLYRLIEALYFANPKNVFKSNSKIKTIAKPVNHVGYSFTVATIVLCICIMLLYIGRYSHLLLIEHQSLQASGLPRNTSVSLLLQKVRIPITARHNNLSIVSIDLDYQKNAILTQQKKTKSNLQFNLFDEQTHKKIFTSQISAFKVAGEKHFQFGFPPIANANHKVYIAEISLLGGTPDDYVLIDTGPTSFVTIYEPESIGAKKLFAVFVNRIWFFFGIPQGVFAVLFLLCLWLAIKYAAWFKK